MSKQPTSGPQRDRPYTCDRCGSPFVLPTGERVSVHLEGRTIQVICPSCASARGSKATER